MLKKNSVKLIIATICGYIYIGSVPKNDELTEILTQFVFSPSKLLTILLCFLISFTLYASVIFEIVNKLPFLGIKNRKLDHMLFWIISILCVVFLFFKGFWETVFIVCFTYFYFYLMVKDSRKRAGGEV
ncbi:hypothetical protein ACWE42_01345 [Sutcliffiella cohnii]